MEVQSTSVSSRPAPTAEAPKAPQNEPKKPQDNAAAKQAPGETKHAVQNSFGDVPKNGNPKQPDDGKKSPGNQPKLPVTTPKEGGDAKTSAGNAQLPADAKAPPAAAPVADPKAAPGTPGSAVEDANGNPYMVLPDGEYAVTEEGNYVVYDKANANNPVAIDTITGNAIKDPAGNIRAIGQDGNFIRTADGDNVVYNKTGNKYNLIATGKDGNPMVIHGYPAAVDAAGNYRQTLQQDAVVIDKMGNPVALDKEGKQFVINDHPAAVGKDGSFLPNVVYDKATGFRAKIVDGEIQKSADGKILAVDENGKDVLDAQGLPATYDPRGVPVQSMNIQTPTSKVDVYKDVTTGEQVGLASGYVYKIDTATGELAKDANGKLLPAIYDPVNSDPTRPPVRPNEDAATTLKNLPQGKERGDPMAIKDELFDEAGNLDVDKMRDATAKYDARDVYDALINASRFEGWDKLPVDSSYFGAITGVVHPNEKQSREVIATLMAWQNMNGKYAPIKKGEVPPIVLYDKTTSDVAGAFNEGIVYVKLGDNTMATLFHELSHSKNAKAFYDTYNAAPEGVVPQDEIVTEYIASKWTGESKDSAYEADAPRGFKQLDDAVKALGGGDVDKGMDILQRAYFAGDLEALDKFKAIYRPK